MKFFRTYDSAASKGKWKEFVDEMEFDSMVQEPRTMAQEPRNMYSQGQLVRNTVDGSRPGYNGKGGSSPGYRANLLENLPDGYLDDYKANFYNTIKDGKLTHKGGAQPPSVKGSLKKGIPYMMDKYGMKHGKIADTNSALKASFQSQIESGAKMGYNIRIGQLRAVAPWNPKAPKGMATHHFLPKLGIEGTDINFASTRNTAFISSELNSNMSPYDTKLKRIQLEQIELLENKPKGWEKKIEDLNTRARGIYKNAAKELPGSAGYLGFSEIKVKPDGSYTVEIRGIDYNKSLSGINEADEIFYRDPKTFEPISRENKLKVNKMSNIKVSKPVVLGSFPANIDADMFDFRKLPDGVRHIADITKKYAAQSPKVLSALKKAKWIGGALATEPLWAAPFAAYEHLSGESPERMLGTATFGLFGETEKEELKKATGELGYATKQIDNYASTLKALKNKYLSFNDQNDPRGKGRKITENMYTNTHGKYSKAYNMFVDDQGEFDKGKYDQALNNYTAGLVQIDKFKKQKQEEREQKRIETAEKSILPEGYDPQNPLTDEVIRNIKGFTTGGRAGYMGGGIMNLKKKKW